MSNYSRFNSSCKSDTNHVLIKNNNEYILETKLLYVSSNDRDTSKWPKSNDFEIMCPQSYTNVQSLKLVDIQLPNNLYNISNHLQNNKMRMVYDGASPVIVVPDGLYTPNLLERALEYLLNTAAGTNTNTITVEYNQVTNKFYFKSSLGSVKFDFTSNADLSYNVACPKNRISSVTNDINVYGQYANWGLGALLGFDKEVYTFETVTNNNDFVWESSGNTGFIRDFSGVVSPNMANLFGDNNILMELEKYNSIDELTPYITSMLDNSGICASYTKEYSDNSVYLKGRITQIKNSSYYRKENFDRSAKLDYNGSINNAFAKIPMANNATYGEHGYSGNRIMDSAGNNLSNQSEYHPPVDKISKMRFRFRYHNGLLVDFQNMPITFTIEISHLRNDFKR